MIIKYVLPFTLLSASFMANANLRWFDIELIFFERQLDSELKEDLSADDLTAIDYSKTKDIIADAYQEIQKIKYKECTGELDITVNQEETHSTGEQRFERTVTEPEMESTVEIMPEQDAPTEFDDKLLTCQKDTEITALETLPLTPEALTQEHTDYIYLLSEEQLELKDTVARLKQRGLKPLLHTGWRQPESNVRNATPMYLYGGKNLSAVVNKKEKAQSLEQMLEEYTQFDTSYEMEYGIDESSTETLHQALPEIDNTREESILAKQTWQLEGKFKVFIRHNYLNIEADFDLNDLTEQTVEQINFEQNQNTFSAEQLTETVLKTDRFSQFRRVISSEIHYFDHPRLGVIMQIRRYNH
jgi:hypothetical protein